MTGLPKLPKVGTPKMPRTYHLPNLSMRKMMTIRLKGFMKSGAFKNLGKPKGWGKV